jgi:hypothetical protein
VVHRVMAPIRTEQARQSPLRARTSVSIHPAVVATDLVGDQNLWQRVLIHASQFGKLLKPEEGALNQVWAATADRDHSKYASRIFWPGIRKVLAATASRFNTIGLFIPS